MKSFAFKIFVLAAAGGLAGCSTVDVTTDYDHSATFGKYKTYTLAPASRANALSPTAEAALQDALRTNLGARGITEATSGQADLAIVRHVFLTDKTSVQEYSTLGYGYHGGWPYRYGYYNGWAGSPVSYFDVSHYTQGTLVLDAVDMRTKKLVFRGTGTAIVEGVESNADKIREGVKKMVSDLPR